MASDTDYVDLNIEVDANSLADDAIEGLRAKWDGWEPNDGDLEVVAIEETAPMAAAVARVASLMPREAFRVFGTEIFQVPYNSGLPATTTVTLTMVDDTGYTLFAGMQLAIDGFAFGLAADVTIANGDTEAAGVLVVCTLDGQAANGLTGAVVASLTLPPSVVAIAVEAPTDNGVDDEPDDAYRNRVSRELILRAKTLITARDFALDALEAGAGRAWASGNTARQIDVWLTDTAGLATSGTFKTSITDRWGLAERSVNVTYTIHDADYCQVNVDWSVKADPAFAPGDLTDAINAVLRGELDPLAWSGYGPSGWTNNPVVQKNLIIGLIAQVNGVVLVEDVSLSSPTVGAVEETNGDLTMPGTAALPQVGDLSGTVDF